MLREELRHRSRALIGEIGRRERLERLAGSAAYAFVFVLLTRARIAGDFAAFGAAGMSAGLSAGWPAGAMLIGCALGCLGAQSPQGWLPLMSCLMIWGLWQGLRWVAPKLGLLAAYPGGRARYRSQEAFTAGFALLGVLAPGLMIVRSAGEAAYAALTALIAGAVAPALVEALSIRWNRRQLLPEERISLLLLAMVALCGLWRLPLGAPLARLAAALLVLICAGAGPSAGAVAGICAGISLAISGEAFILCAALAACGLIAGTMRTISRPASALALCIGMLIALMRSDAPQSTVGHFITYALSATAYCAIPLPVMRRMWRLIEPGRSRRIDPNQLASHMHEDARRKVTNLAAVFDALSNDVCASPSDDAQILAARIRLKLCENCDAYLSCWRNPEGGGREVVNWVSGGSARGGKISCLRAGQAARRLRPVIDELAAQRARKSDEGERRMNAERHFREASRLLTDLSERMQSAASPDPIATNTAAGALEREGLPTADVTALRGDCLKVYATLSRGRWNDTSIRRAARCVSDALGVNLTPAYGESFADSAELALAEAPRFSLQTAVRHRTARAGLPCGDSAIAAPIGERRALLALSDGMGSGARAAAESRETIALLQTFLSAGVGNDLALEAINGLMMNRRSDEIFATVDLCMLDLSRGEASFQKLGACASVIVRGDEVIRIEGGRLPLGIVETVRPVSRTAALRNGDLIVMVSDGVADDSRAGGQEWLQSRLCASKTRDPESLAQFLIASAIERDAGRPGDDMTALVALVEEDHQS